MEEVEYDIVKSNIIVIGDFIIDADDILDLCNKIERGNTSRLVGVVLECIFHMPVKIGIYTTVLGILCKRDNELRKSTLNKLNQKIEVFAQTNSLSCILWLRCMIGLGCCGTFDFKHCVNSYKEITQYCKELYAEKKYVKADKLMYIFLTNFFFISKQMYDKYEKELNECLNTCFELINERQQWIENLNIEDKDEKTIEYIYVFTQNVLHGNIFIDRLYELKEALVFYLKNQLKSCATHRFYQKEVFQKIFLEDRIASSNENQTENPDELNNALEKSPKDLGNTEEDSLEKNYMNVECFKKCNCLDSIDRLQISFHTDLKKEKQDNSGVEKSQIVKFEDNKQDVWLMQEYILNTMRLYKNNVRLCSKVLGIYVQLQSDLYNHVLVECIINKLLATFYDRQYYFYISLLSRLMTLKKNLVHLIVRCIRFLLKRLDKLDAQSYERCLELCVVVFGHFVYEDKTIKQKEMIFNRKLKDYNRIAQFKESVESRKRGISEVEKESDSIATGTGREKVVLRKNEETIKRLKLDAGAIPKSLDNVKDEEVEKNADEITEEKRKKIEGTDAVMISDSEEEEKNEEEEEEEEEEENSEDIGKRHINISLLKKQIEQLALDDQLKKMLLIIFNVKRKFQRKWVCDFYDRCCATLFRDGGETYIPEEILNYCKMYKNIDVDKSFMEYNEYTIFWNLIDYGIQEYTCLEDLYYDKFSNKIGHFNEHLYTLRHRLNKWIACFMNFLNGKSCLRSVPFFFQNVHSSMSTLHNISLDQITMNFYAQFIHDSDFLKPVDDKLWTRETLLFLFFKCMLYMISTGNVEIDVIVKNHIDIFLKYKSDILKTENERIEFDSKLTEIVFQHFKNSTCIESILSSLFENQMIEDSCVVKYLFRELRDDDFYKYYIIKIPYKLIKILLESKLRVEEDISDLKNLQVKDENEEDIKKKEEAAHIIENRIISFTNQVVNGLSEKLMKFKKENESILSEEFMKELLLFLRSFKKYIDMDNFLQICQDNNYNYELFKLATIFKYATL